MKGMYINGQWARGHRGESMKVLNPATEEIPDLVPDGSADDASDAVTAASSAYQDWRWVTGLEKADMLQLAAQKIRQHFAEVVNMLTLEEGKPISENEEEVEWVIGTLNYCAGMARTYRGRLLAPAERSQFNFVMKEPFGVVACIVPFNYPLLLMIWKVAPAIADGNTVVVKPAMQTPLSRLMLAEIAFDHLPEGVFNVVTGGAKIGEPLVSHPKVSVIAFRGSVTTGQRTPDWQQIELSERI